MHTPSMRWKTLDWKYEGKKRDWPNIGCDSIFAASGRLRGALCVQRCYVLVKCSIRVCAFLCFFATRCLCYLLLLFAVVVAVAACCCCCCCKCAQSSLHTTFYFTVYSTCKFEYAKWFAGCGMWLRKRFMLCAR